MKITSVEPQKKNQKRFNVFLDGQFGFGADEDTVVEFRLIPGKEITQEELDNVLQEAEVGKLMGRMYNLISIRMRSEKEIRDYFKIKNKNSKIKDKEEVSDILIEKVIENLKDKGLINDEVFARAWVESRRRSKKKGVNALKSELIQKGINRETIEEVLGDGLLVMGEQKLASEALEKKIKAWKNLERSEFKKKAIEFLVRRGFSFGVAKEVVDSEIKKLYNSS